MQKAVAHFFAIMAFVVVILALMAGFEEASPKETVVFGCLSACFWLIASALPLYLSRLRAATDLLNGFNAFAAACTGAAVITSVPNAWAVLLS